MKCPLHKYKDLSSVPNTMQKPGTISTSNHSAEKVGAGRSDLGACKISNIAVPWSPISVGDSLNIQGGDILRNDT